MRRKRKGARAVATLFWLCVLCATALGDSNGDPKIVTVRPRVINDVLVNPGMGFMTFQRFNGDPLNKGMKWTEGHPIDYAGLSREKPRQAAYPPTSIAYFRIYWRFLEPEQEKFRWDLIDDALKGARAHGQTLMLRVAPYGDGKDEDVPDWYRKITHEIPGAHLKEERWRVDPELPSYSRYFGGMVRALGARYDGKPGIESVDVAWVGPWGEGAGSELLTEATRKTLADAYLQAFHKTPLIIQLTDLPTVSYLASHAKVGWRADCLGDLGGFSPAWAHMYDLYPEEIIQLGMQDAWKTAPVTMEACWVMRFWQQHHWDVDYIIDQSLKWHLSSFNAKSSAIPRPWRANVDRWLRKMGYRLALRKFTYPRAVKPGAALAFTSWWENLGVAPCYRAYPLMLRIRNKDRTIVLSTQADITHWLPGDSLYDSSVNLPADLPPGDYELALAIADPTTRQPVIRLAIAGRAADGWYPMGPIRAEAK